MTTNEPIYDAILTYAPSEVSWAVDVEKKLADVGVNAYRIVSPEGGGSLDDTWEAHFESHALIVLIAPGAVPPLLMFEAGAAMMGQKPVYVLYKGQRPSNLPRYVERFGVFPASDVDQMVKLVSETARPFPDRERQLLVKVYEALKTPLDQLFDDRNKTEQLTLQFNRLTKSLRPSEVILRELLRLRKKGALSRHKHVSRTPHQTV